jgi:hypothetical protein
MHEVNGVLGEIGFSKYTPMEKKKSRVGEWGDVNTVVSVLPYILELYKAETSALVRSDTNLVFQNNTVHFIP